MSNGPLSVENADCEGWHIYGICFVAPYRKFYDWILMADTTPINALDIPRDSDGADSSLLSEISQSLGLMSGKQRYERWKQKLREELVREHIAVQKKKSARRKSLFRKLFRLD